MSRFLPLEFRRAFDAVNALTAISDADETQYGASVSCDPNGNITQLLETYSTGNPPVINSSLTTDFTYDNLNRLSQHKTTRYVGGGTNKNQYTERNHSYDATGRLAKSSYSQYYAGDSPTTDSLEHVYDSYRHLQNYDGTNYGSVWHWAGASNSHGSALRSPNADTASQSGYNIGASGGKNTPQRRTWLNPTTEGNKRELFGQGRPMAKDSSGNGTNWWVGTKSDPPISGTAVESRFFFEGTVSATDMSRATDGREAYRVGIFGTSNSYGGAYGRVTNEALGRDLNPLGRGSMTGLVAGALNIGNLGPFLPMAVSGSGTGNSVNNGGSIGMGGGGSAPPQIEGCCCQIRTAACIDFAYPPPPRDYCAEYIYRVSALGQSPCKEENHRLLCECIAYGCNPGNVRGCVLNPVWSFHNCGCEKFGELEPWKGQCCNCSPGKIKGGGGDGGSGGGPKALMSPGGGGCAQCGGGGGRLATRAPIHLNGRPLGRAVSYSLGAMDCEDVFNTALSELASAVGNTGLSQKCCCLGSADCPVCNDLAAALRLGPSNWHLLFLDFNDRSYKKDCFDKKHNPRVLFTNCTTNNIKVCCPNFTPPYTGWGGTVIGTSNPVCAAMVYLATDMIKCQHNMDTRKCFQSIIDVVLCLCEGG